MNWRFSISYISIVFCGVVLLSLGIYFYLVNFSFFLIGNLLIFTVSVLITIY